MTRRVVITGMGGVTAFGENWQAVSARLLAYENAVRKMPEWQVYDGLHTLLGAPIDDFTLPEHYTRKRIRAMGRVSLMSTRATELALEQAGLIGDRVLTNGETGIAYGSSTGSTGPVSEFATMLTKDAAFPKRLGHPEEYAKLAAAIVDNPMLNGQCIRLDAGQRFAPR